VASTEEIAGGSLPRSEASEKESVDPGDQASQSSTADNLTLYFESKRRLLDLLALFAEHGYVNLEEVASSLGRTSELMSSLESMAMRARIRELEEAVRSERLAAELAAWDLAESERALASERELVRESVARIANLEGQLTDARRTTLKVIAASRNSLATLKRVRDHLAQEKFATSALTPLVRDFRELTQVVQELHVLAAVKATATPSPIVPR